LGARLPARRHVHVLPVHVPRPRHPRHDPRHRRDALFVDHQPADVSQLVRFSRELRPTAWYNLSGPLVIAIEQYAAATGIDLADAFASYRGVTLAGEPIGPRARRRVEDGWGLELFVHTGVGDVGAATECREHDGCHI